MQLPEKIKQATFKHAKISIECNEVLIEENDIKITETMEILEILKNIDALLKWDTANCQHIIEVLEAEEAGNG
ncbi:MAG: hypothetical protein WC551_11405 [Patescibacteria group bacterium]